MRHGGQARAPGRWPLSRYLKGIENRFQMSEEEIPGRERVAVAMDPGGHLRAVFREQKGGGWSETRMMVAEHVGLWSRVVFLWVKYR